MQANTRIFGEIDIADEKILNFENGIIGFPDFKKFALIHDLKEEGETPSISWLQSMEEPSFAMPVMDPLIVKPDYNPMVSDDYFSVIDGKDDNEYIVLVTVTVPHDLKKMSVNLKAPFVINVSNRKAAQIIVEEDFPIKYMIYDILNKKDGE